MNPRRASIDAAPGRLLACALAALGLVSLGACRQDMQQGPRFNPLAEASEVFGNGSSARTPVPGTVARGMDVSGSFGNSLLGRLAG